jgi:hypothetical protein
MPPITFNTTGCLKSSEREKLAFIHQPDYQIGVWERNLPESLMTEVKSMLNSDWKEFRFSGTVNTLAQHLESSRLEPGLQMDVLHLANWYSKLMEGLPLRLFLGKVEHSMCRRFHTDINDLRLLCTYQGPGTLWVRPDAIRKEKVAKGTNEEMIKDPSGVHQANPGEVLLIKGALHEQSTHGSTLHRSPALEPGQVRLLLRIDTGGAFNFQ